MGKISLLFFDVAMASRSIALIYIPNFPLSLTFFWDNIFKNFLESSKKYLAFVLVEELRNDQGDHEKAMKSRKFLSLLLPISFTSSLLLSYSRNWHSTMGNFSFYLSNNRPRPRYFFTFITFAKKIFIFCKGWTHKFIKISNDFKINFSMRLEI